MPMPVIKALGIWNQTRLTLTIHKCMTSFNLSQYSVLALNGTLISPQLYRLKDNGQYHIPIE
jgi:hypothetical protein